MSPAEVQAMIDQAIRSYRDNDAGVDYLKLTRLYWLDVPDGDFSAAPDPEVVAALGAFLGTGGGSSLRSIKLQTPQGEIEYRRV